MRGSCHGPCFCTEELFELGSSVRGVDLDDVLMVVLYQCPASVSHSFKRGSNPKIVQYQYIRGTTGITTHTLLHPSAVPRPGVNDVSFVSGGDLGKPSLLRSYQFIHATQERGTRDSDVVLEVELDKCLGLGLITRSRAKEDHCFVWVPSEDWPEAAGSARTPIPLCPTPSDQHTLNARWS